MYIIHRGGVANLGASLMAKTNQDAYVAYEGLPDDSLVLAVFDGHGSDGHRVSEASASLLPTLLSKHAAIQGHLDDLAIKNAFIEIDKMVCNNREGYCANGSGTTATVLIKRGKQLVCANAGDSKCLVGAVLADGRVKARPLNNEHGPELPSEKARILAAGGRLDRLRGMKVRTPHKP